MATSNRSKKYCSVFGCTNSTLSRNMNVTINVGSVFDCKEVDYNKLGVHQYDVDRWQFIVGCHVFQILREMYKFKNMNVTINVGSVFDCKEVDYNKLGVHQYDVDRWQFIVGCHVFQILREMYKFNVTYVQEIRPTKVTDFPQYAGPVDFYIRPMALWNGTVRYATPIHNIFMWRFGFILRKSDSNQLRLFYSLPFTLAVWEYILFAILIFTVMSYLIHKWEKKVTGSNIEASLSHELLVVIAAHCQQSLPTKATLPSRRAFYLTLFLFAFIIYSYYTSNLLSNLVNIRPDDMDLEDLVNSDYQCAELTSLELKHAIYLVPTIIEKMVSKCKTMSVKDGLEAVRTSEAALLSDYITVYPYIKKSFDVVEMCELVEIDVFSNVKKYLFAAKDFSFTEQLKVGTLRAKETGVLNRLFSQDSYLDMQCDLSPLIHTRFTHIFNAIILLGINYVIALVVFFIEKHHYHNTRKLWPYLD